MKQYKRLKQRLDQDGWRQRAGKGAHTFWYCPCGEHMVSVAGSVSDRRAWLNLVRDISKCPTWKHGKNV